MTPTIESLQLELALLKQEMDRFASLDRKLQILLSLEYRRMVGPIPLSDIQFRSFSQNGEDGILLYLFSVIGTTNRMAVEISAGNGMECNTANLIINHGWRGLLIDGDPANMEWARHQYSRFPDTCLSPPQMVEAWVTRENVNQLVQDHGFSGEIDLLSLDLDGNDYWVWKELACIRPRVVVLEYNAIFGPDRAVSIPYDPQFRLDLSRTPYYCGASLAAFVKLGREKGYRFVGSERLQFNAFFVREDLADDRLPAASVERFSPGASPAYDWADRLWIDV